MLDILMLAFGLGFFALAFGYVFFCETCEAMLIDHALGGVVTLLILAYLLYALLRPERL